MSCNLARNIFRNCLGLIAAIFLTPHAFAEDNAPKGPEFGGYMATVLPNQIKGVTEILPAWGVRYSYPLTVGYIEGGLRDSHAKGVDFDVLSIDYRYDTNQIEGFTNIFYLGYNENYYRPVNTTKRNLIGGGFFGSGLMMKVASTFWLRTDLSLAVSPGTSLMLGLGFVIRAPGGNN